MRNSLRINIGRGLIENEQAIVPQDGPGQTYELSLTDAEVVTAVRDIVVQRGVVQLDLSQHIPQLHVIVLIERVQIVAQTFGEQHWFLRYDGDLATQLIQVYLARVQTVDLNLALQALVKKTEERWDQGGFASASSSHHPNFPARLNGHVQILQGAIKYKQCPQKWTIGLPTFKTGESSAWYFMLTFFKISCPWDGHVGGGGLSEVDPSWGRFVYWRILSTEVISDIVSVDCLMPYCRQPIRINDCDIARPTLLSSTLSAAWRWTKGFVIARRCVKLIQTYFPKY